MRRSRTLPRHRRLRCFVAAGARRLHATSTYGTGEAPEMALFREMTGGLLDSEQEEPIEYQPRAPLVMPPRPRGALPPPGRDRRPRPIADWPMDPDEARLARTTPGTTIIRERHHARPNTAGCGRSPARSRSSPARLGKQHGGQRGVATSSTAASSARSSRRRLHEAKGLRPHRAPLSDRPARSPIASRLPTAPTGEVRGIEEKAELPHALVGGG